MRLLNRFSAIPGSPSENKHPKLGVIQPLGQILADALPMGIDPKAHRLKGLPGAHRGQSPAHLRLPQILSLCPLQTHLGAVHQQPDKRLAP